MAKYLSIFILLVGISAFSQKEKKTLKYFDSGTMYFERVFPACTDYNAAGVPNYNVIGLEGEFLSLTLNNWKIKQKASFDLGGKKTEDLISNIQFQGGYLGGLSVWSNRFTSSIGTVVAFQPNPKLEIGIPVMFIARYTSEIGRYYLYDGQTVDPADEVGGAESSSSNRIVINRKWMPGFKTGLELVGLPNSELSFLCRVNYHYFGWRDVYDVSKAQLIPSTNTIDVVNDRVWSTPEWGISLGVRWTMYYVSKEVRRSERKEKKDDSKVILTPEKRQ